MMHNGAFIACALALATGACGGEVAAPACEARADEATCSGEAQCVWLSPAPKGCASEYDGRHSACFERARTAEGAVCGPYETRHPYWQGCSVNDQVDPGIAACWDVRRR